MVFKLNDEISYKLLKLLEQDSNTSQRQLAKALGVSVGKINYYIKELAQIGLVKKNGFTNLKHKAGCIYELTSKGVAEKPRIARRFLANRLEQYEVIKKEIAMLKMEIDHD